MGTTVMLNVLDATIEQVFCLTANEMPEVLRFFLI